MGLEIIYIRGKGHSVVAFCFANFSNRQYIQGKFQGILWLNGQPDIQMLVISPAFFAFVAHAHVLNSHLVHYFLRRHGVCHLLKRKLLQLNLVKRTNF